MPDVYALQPFLPAARASTPVWRDSATKPVKWQPMSKKAAVKLWHRARVFERGTRQPGRQDGALGRNGLAVLHALIFDCLNYATGRLDPAINTIARLACISPRSAARGLAALKLAGVLDWVRRCRESIEDGRFTLRQESNAYAVTAPVQLARLRAAAGAIKAAARDVGRPPLDARQHRPGCGHNRAGGLQGGCPARTGGGPRRRTGSGPCATRTSATGWLRRRIFRTASMAMNHSLP